MRIQIKETGQIRRLTAIDPETETEGTRKLLKRQNQLGPYNPYTNAHIMPQSNFDWWEDVLPRYQRTLDQSHELTRSINASAKLRKVIEGADSEAEDYFQRTLEAICDEHE